jgi:hypothetical protein
LRNDEKKAQKSRYTDTPMPQCMFRENQKTDKLCGCSVSLTPDRLYEKAEKGFKVG